MQSIARRPKKVKIASPEYWGPPARLTREERKSWEAMYRELESEFRMIVWAIRRGNVPPPHLVAVVQTLVDELHAEGLGDAVPLDVIDPWYVLHPHPDCSA